MKKNTLDISVVMAEYNTNIKDLKMSIRSILDQSFQNFEFIIVDDHGNNDLLKIVTDFRDNRIKVIKNNKNMGLVYSLNTGIRQAEGRFIVRMDTDDIALPNRIEKLYFFILAHPEYDVVSSRAIEFSGDNDFGVLGKSGEKDKKAIMRDNTLIHPSVIFRKAAVANVGFYDDYVRSEDLGLWCKLLINGSRLYTIDDILLKYRVNPSDYSKRTLKNRKGQIKVRFNYYPKMGASLVDYLFILKSIIAGILPIRFVLYYRNKFVLNKTPNRNGKE